jgi:transcriptional antiterminator NusG
MSDLGKRWYVVQTYSGYENSVKKDLESRIETLGMTDFIFTIIVPEKKEIVKDKKGKEKEKISQLFPGYVFVEMIVTDESWYVVRNTPRVTGFLGSSGGGTKPVPLLEEEIKPLLLKVGLLTKPDYSRLIGREVEIIHGSFAGQVGVVATVDNDRERLIVNVEFFGRQTPHELAFTDFKEL